MTRFRSIGVTDHDVRQKLRERFQHALRAVPSHPWYPHEAAELDDVAALNLLLNTRVESNAQQAAFEARYRSARAHHPEMPDFADAVARGWFQVLEGRVIVASAARDFVRHTHPSYENAFLEVANWSWELRFTVDPAQLAGTSAAWAELLRDAYSANPVLAVRSPAWVAARLWEQTPPPDLWQWYIKWRLLGSPDFTPGEVWPQPVEAAFTQAAIENASVAGLGSWAAFLNLELVPRLRALGDARLAAAEDAPAPPPHLLGKLLATRRPAYEPDEGDAASMSALAITARNVARRLVGPLPQPEVAIIVRLAGAHPDVLELLERIVSQEPRLLADLLMHRETAVLAAYLVAIWQPVARTEAEEEEAVRELRMTAFADAIDIVSDHVHANDADPVEYAELLVTLQGYRHNAQGVMHEPWARRVARTIGVLKRASTGFQRTVLDELSQRGRQGVGTPAFSVLLEVIEAVAPEVAAQSHPSVLVAYRAAIAPGADLADLELLAEPLAHTLVKVLVGAGAEGRELLRTPVRVADTLAAEPEEAAKRQMEFRLARSVRTHIRILARATVAWGEAVPTQVIDALEHAIGIGALDDAAAAAGKVPAFSGFGDAALTWARRQRPIAHEVAQAIRRVGAPHRRGLVDALLGMDEPGVLAEFAQRLPMEFRGDIERRIEQLVPSGAGHMATITELQHTIRQLLGAGLTQAAERFMAVEESMATMGRVSGRDVERFRARLHTMLLKRQYDEILAAALPASLSEDDARSARDVLDLHQGLVYLDEGVHKDAVKAQAIFQRLHTQSPEVKMYAINLLAARVDLVLPDNMFAKAVGAGRDRARHALEEAASAVPPGSLPGEQQAVHATNVATLQLSLGQTSEALATLRRIDAGDVLPASIAVEAVARAREGLPEQALLFLKHAEARFGTHGAFDGATRHIEEGVAYVAVAGKVAQESKVEGLRQWLGQFKLADALVQAQVSATGVPPLEALLTGIVRDALASLANLVPALGLHEDKLHEDIINTLVRETLRVQLAPWYGWSVADQSLGGRTATGRRLGERDIAIGQGATELAVIEAMRYSTSGDGGVESHLKKVVAYSPCKLFFHVTYAHERDPRTVLEAVRNIATTRPGSLVLQAPLQPLPSLGNQPDGWIGRYEDASGRRITIVFLVADLLQHGQRSAFGATPAAVTTPGAPSAANPAPTPAP